MSSAIRQLLVPLNYIHIKHKQKILYDIALPLSLSIPFYILVYFGGLPSVGVAIIFSYLMPVLIGGNLVALSFSGMYSQRGMDEKMLGTPPTLAVRRRGVWVTEELTRRRFLTLLFGYLSMLSSVIYLIGALSIIGLPLLNHFPAVVIEIAEFIYFFLLFNLCVNTLLGVGYIAERISRDEA